MPPQRLIYDGLLAAVYDEYTDFDQRDDLELWFRLAEMCGGAVLELASGSGRILLPMLAAGLPVEGLDISADMLARCRAKAADMNLSPVLHHAGMTDFALDQRFALVFCAAGSFTLLAEPGCMARALLQVRAHMAPGGLLALAMDAPGPHSESRVVARDLRRATDGARLQCIMDPLPDPDREVVRWRMTNIVTAQDGTAQNETCEIAFRHPAPTRFANMLREAGFNETTLLNAAGTGPMQEGDDSYLALARLR